MRFFAAILSTAAMAVSVLAQDPVIQPATPVSILRGCRRERWDCPGWLQTLMWQMRSIWLTVALLMCFLTAFFDHLSTRSVVLVWW